MHRVVAIAICGLMLAGCGSLSLLGDGESAPVILKLASKPPGAEAKLSNGASCVTPCELPVAPGNDINVSFSLARHQPQSVTVHAVAAKKNFVGAESSPASFEPNPVVAELQPVAAPKKPRPKRRPALAAKPAPAPALPGAPAVDAAAPKPDQPAAPAAVPVPAGQTTTSTTAAAPSAPPASPWPGAAPTPR